MILDDEAAEKQIMVTDDSEQQQAIGRNAKNYNNTVWNGISQAVAMAWLAGQVFLT